MQTVGDPTGRVTVLTCQHIRVADIASTYIYIVEKFDHVCRGLSWSYRRQTVSK